MKKSNQYSIQPLILFFVFFCFATYAQNEKENSLLWKIEGKDLEKPSYIFGTIHAICPADFIIKDKVKKAIQESDILIQEVNLSDTSEMREMMTLMFSPEKLSEGMTTDKKKELDSVLKESLGMPLFQVDNMSSTALMSLLIFKIIPCNLTEVKTYEKEILNLFQKDKQVLGLETMKEQFEYMESAIQVDDIFELIGQFKEYKESFKNMVEAYKSEDLKALMKMVKDERFMSKEDSKILIDNRNKNWIPKLETNMAKNSLFVAVGAGHLGGSNGLIELLKAQGYEVQPVLD